MHNASSVVPAQALMSTMLVQEHKDKTITHTVHEVLKVVRPIMPMSTNER